MIAQETLDLGDDLLIEIQEQRRDSLRNFAILQIAMGLLWLVFVSWQEQHGINSIPAYIAVLGGWSAFRLADRHYSAGCIMLLSMLTVAVCAALMLYPTPLMLMSGITIVIAANAVLSPIGALGATLLLWSAMTIAWHRATGDTLLAGTAIGSLVMYLLAWGASFLAGLPFARSVDSAITGWTQARHALSEAQDRRAELYRVVRALEEATYRIERINSELLIAREEAESARALKAHFVATVSHEIRGPLNLLLGFSRMIALFPEKYGEPLPESFRADIDAIYRNSEHLATLVDDVLDLSQIEADSLPLMRDRIDLYDDVIDKVVESSRPLAERKGLFLRVQVERDLPRILADAVRVRQVLLNLLTNAIRFTKEGGITLSSWIEESSLTVSVEDTGTGIALEDMPRLFREFSQVQETETREEAGSGLGLAISKQLIELHGGTIWAESVKGSGTTVRFSLPLPSTDRSETRLKSSGRAGTLRAPDNVALVVHDDADMVRSLARFMGDYRIIGVSNAEDIIGFVQEMYPRAIITTDALRQPILALLADLPFDVPVVSFREPHPSQHHLRGVVSQLVKPINPETLWTVMRGIVSEETIKILLVDDEPDAVRLMTDMLTLLPHDYSILHAYDGTDALEIMEEVTPDIVFLDLMMKELSGYDTLSRMRELEQLRDIPVIIVSARDTSDHDLTIAGPVRLDFRDEMTFSQGNKLLETLLNSVNPRYLPAPEPPQWQSQAHAH